MPPSMAALRSHEALHSVRQHKKIGLTVRRVILNDFVRRNREPLIFYPSIPPVFWIPFVSALYLKFRLYSVGYGTNPPSSKAPDRPDFHRRAGFARRLARKGREIAPSYVGWDDVKVILLATSPLAEADCAPFMTRGPDPLWASMATPPGPGFAQLAQGVVAAVALGWRSLAEADSGRIHDCWACPPKGHLWRALYLRLCQTRRRMCEDAWAAEYDPLNTIRH